MKINVISMRSFEPWDARNPEEFGIGGSENAHIELSRRLAARGHEVTSYAPIREDSTDDGSVKWRHHSEADLSEECLWLVFRQPDFADSFEPSANRRAWMVAEDVVYFDGCGGAYTKERADKFDRILALSQPHFDYLASSFPFLVPRLCLSSNGIESDRIPLSAGPRDPMKLFWCSSPDRGLEALLLIFARALEFEPRLRLISTYGFNNWDKVIDANPGCPQEAMKKRTLDLIAACGDAVVWRGRVGQSEVWNEMLTAGLWVYPSTFEETSCCSCMLAQACGAIPITNSYWAVGQNVKHGVFVQGDPLNDALTRARYAQWIVRLARDEELAEKIRGSMMQWARSHFDWERIVDHYEGWIEEDFPAPRVGMMRELAECC